jgi:hypothetical protein
VAAHEAAHIIQQQKGVHLAGGMGTVGDAYERHADAIADRVLQGGSAESLLDQHVAHAPAPGGAVQALAIQFNGLRDVSHLYTLQISYDDVHFHYVDNPNGAGGAAATHTEHLHITFRNNSHAHPTIHVFYNDQTQVWRTYRSPYWAPTAWVTATDLVQLQNDAISWATEFHNLPQPLPPTLSQAVPTDVDFPALGS